MTGLAETALAFCQECLGWEQPEIRDSIIVFRSSDPLGPSHGFVALQNFTDLNAVMLAASEWCKKVKLTLSFIYFPNVAGFDDGIAEPAVRRLTILRVGDDGGVHFGDPCHALLTACVEANRKLKGTTDAA